MLAHGDFQARWHKNIHPRWLSQRQAEKSEQRGRDPAWVWEELRRLQSGQGGGLLHMGSIDPVLNHTESHHNKGMPLSYLDWLHEGESLNLTLVCFTRSCGSLFETGLMLRAWSRQNFQMEISNFLLLVIIFFVITFHLWQMILNSGFSWNAGRSGKPRPSFSHGHNCLGWGAAPRFSQAALQSHCPSFLPHSCHLTHLMMKPMLRGYGWPQSDRVRTGLEIGFVCLICWRRNFWSCLDISAIRAALKKKRHKWIV